MTYYVINEELARLANDMNSHREYVAGSATKEYCYMVDQAEEIADKQRKKVDPLYHGKIDALLNSYCKRLADNINARNRIATMCPSILVSGGSNFPVRKKEKQNAASDKNTEEFLEIEKIKDKIRSVGTGGISSDDPDAVKKLKLKIEQLEKEQKFAKALNRYYKKHGTCVGFESLDEKKALEIDAQIKEAYSWEQKPFPSYELTSINNKIKRAKARIVELDEQQARCESGWDFQGGHVVLNKELNRVQLVFEEKPDKDMREQLKAYGFRWAPSQTAWQRMLNDNGIAAARKITQLAQSLFHRRW